jgi:hypothetical protein
MPHGYLATIYSAAWLTNWNAQEKARNRIVNVRIAPLTWIVSPLITKARVSARRAHPTTHLDPAGQLAKFHEDRKVSLG